MTTETLTPTQLVPDGPGLNITPLLAVPTQDVLQFANTGREMLVITTSAGTETAQVDIGVTVLGQTVANFDAVSLTNTDLFLFGPFHSAIDAPGTTTAQITLTGTLADVQVALLQFVGVF